MIGLLQTHTTQSYTGCCGLDAPYVEASVIWNEEKRELVVFAVNRSLEEDVDLSLVLEGFDTAVITEHIELYAEDLKAVNTKDDQSVSPKKKEVARKVSAKQQITLQKHSWNMIRFSY